MRFLTPKGKRHVLAAWERTKQAWHIGEINGPGEPDADIIPWCDRINELPGICTLQSCAGHRDGKFKSDGHLWLWMNHVVHSRFHANAFLLLQNADHIDSLSTLYLNDGKEVASITFYGNGHDQLNASMTLIYGFLCGIANEVITLTGNRKGRLNGKSHGRLWKLLRMRMASISYESKVPMRTLINQDGYL